MVRALWTGASGMIAQQTNVDTIANNLANVNTIAYKKETVEFKSLLYHKLQTETTDHNGDPKPVIGQVGSGVKLSSIASRFTQGNLQMTENPYDLAIEGDGFFAVGMNGETVYTRNGSFSMNYVTNGVMFTTSEGYPVLDINGNSIVFDSTYSLSNITIDEDGYMIYSTTEEVTDENGNVHTKPVDEIVAHIAVAQFNNPAGLEKINGSLYRVTPNSGDPRLEYNDSGLKKSKVITGYLEGSNVQTVDEVVNLIVAQRAYEMNSKTITAADEMLQQANNLRG